MHIAGSLLRNQQNYFSYMAFHSIVMRVNHTIICTHINECNITYMHILKFKNKFSRVKYKSYFHDRHFPIQVGNPRRPKAERCAFRCYILSSTWCLYAALEGYSDTVNLSEHQSTTRSKLIYNITVAASQTGQVTGNSVTFLNGKHQN